MDKDLCNRILAHVDTFPWKRHEFITPSGLNFRHSTFWLVRHGARIDVDDELEAFGERTIPEFENRTIEYRIHKYEVGDVVERHCDIAPHRKYSLTVQLSDPTTYEGGDLIIDDQICSREQGAQFLFDSQTIWHSVSPLIRGIRYSLVFWAYAFPLDNSTI